MKRFLFLGVFLILGIASLSAQNVNDYKLKNVLAGFGSGSKLQGDVATAKWLKAGDISGLSLMAAGGIGLAATDLVYKGLEVSVGKVTTADYWISGSVLVTGAAVFITSRVFGYVMPSKFIKNDDVEFSIKSSADEIGIDVKVKL